MMRCVYCRCESELKQDKTNDLVDFEGRIIIIKNVPCMVCTQCGEEYYDNDVHTVLEELFNKAKETLYDYVEMDYEDPAKQVYKLVKIPVQAQEARAAQVADPTANYGK